MRNFNNDTDLLVLLVATCVIIKVTISTGATVIPLANNYVVITLKYFIRNGLFEV